MAEYAQDGIRFEYPDDWEVEDASESDPKTIAVSSLETSFWCLSVFEDCPPVEEVLTAAVSAFEDEYDQVDVYAVSPDPDSAPVCGISPTGRDVEFEYLEMLNTARIRAVATDDMTLMVLYQGTDTELAVTEKMMEGITASLSLE